METGRLPRHQREWRCLYCDRLMERDSEARLENPYCALCLLDRLRAGAESVGPVEWQEERDYLIPTRAR
jgi:hypothetical protein